MCLIKGGECSGTTVGYQTATYHIPPRLDVFSSFFLFFTIIFTHYYLQETITHTHTHTHVHTHTHIHIHIHTHTHTHTHTANTMIFGHHCDYLNLT